MAAVVADRVSQVIQNRAVGNSDLAADLAFLQVTEQSSDRGHKVRLGIAGRRARARPIHRH
jgi:hypothetical protein